MPSAQCTPHFILTAARSHNRRASNAAAADPFFSRVPAP